MIAVSVHISWIKGVLRRMLERLCHTGVWIKVMLLLPSVIPAHATFQLFRQQQHLANHARVKLEKYFSCSCNQSCFVA